MTFDLETANQAEGLHRIAIDPVTRVEGHGKVTILLDAQNRVHQVRLHIVDPRVRKIHRTWATRGSTSNGAETMRHLPSSHHLAASKALDLATGAHPVTRSAEMIRRLVHYGQVLQSHALHFFHLSSPDLLLGFDSDANLRNVAGIAQSTQILPKKGVLLRKFGQEIIRVTPANGCTERVPYPAGW